MSQATLNELVHDMDMAMAELSGFVLAKSEPAKRREGGLSLFRKAIETGIASGKMLPGEAGHAEHILNRITPRPDEATMRKSIQTAFEQNKISLIEKYHHERMLDNGFGHLLAQAGW